MQLYSWCRVCDDLVDDKLAQKNHAFVRQFFDNFLDSVYADDALAPSGSIRTSDPASSLVIRPAGERHLKNPDADHLNELREVVVVGAAPSESVLDKLLPFEKISSFRCIKRLVDKYHMKREELAELIDGFKLDMDMDRREVRIGTTDDLIHYSCCVAASVGVMCCRIFNIPSHRTDVYERARDMGIALQLTNIARYPTRHDTTRHTARHDTHMKARQADWVRQHRDIVTDAKIGRVYVPLQWFESEQERQELLDHPWKNPGRLRQFAESLISLSEPYYRRAEEGVAMLPHEVRTVCVIVIVCACACACACACSRGCTQAQKPVMLGLRFYKEIGHIILKNPSYPERAHAPLMDKLAIALRVYFPPTYRDIGVALGYSLFLACLFL
jgi:phytoene/squalene synthetase